MINLQDIGLRIGELINILKITKSDFAKQLHVSPAFISQVIKDKAKPSNRTILDICRVFNVNENWLKNGVGNMFVTVEDYAAPSIGYRIRIVRKSLKLSQDEFGKRLGVSRGVITNIEFNKTEPKPLFIDLLCREFNADENWLRTGEGEMFLSLDDDRNFNLLCKKIKNLNDPLIIKIMSLYLEMSDEQKGFLQMVFNRLSDK